MRNSKFGLAGVVLGLGVCLFGFSALSYAYDSAEWRYGCELIGVTGRAARDDAIFFGIGLDNPWWPTRPTVWVIQPVSGYKYIGIKCGRWGLDGMNEKGFGFTCAYVEATDSPNPDGYITYLNLGPLLLERCANVIEAIEFLKSVEGELSPEFWPRNQIMGDAEGNLALVEISYGKVYVETLTKDGYVVRTNHFVSDEMKDLDTTPDDFQCERLARGYEFVEERLKNSRLGVQDLFDGFAYMTQILLTDVKGGTVGAVVMEPKKLTYWFTYGWPGGNLPPLELRDRQICQDMTWGVAIPFYLPELPPGQYTNELGALTPLGIQYLYAHFSPELQRSPAWFKYQSVDPTALWYKPAEEVASPNGRTPRWNPYGPGGRPGTWTPDEGYIPPPAEEE